MLGNETTSLRNLLPIAEGLEKDIAIDPVTKKVYVNEDLYNNPLFQTWMFKNKRAGNNVDVVFSEPNVISALRDKGMRAVERVHMDQNNLKSAQEILELGARYRASDIHLNMKGGYTELQFEVDGELRHVDYVKLEDSEPLARAIFQGLCGTKEGYWKSMECQDAQIPDEKLPVGYGLTSARVVRGPAFPVSKGGAFMTIRLQYVRTAVERPRDLPKLEYPPRPEGEFPYRRDNPDCDLSENTLDKLDKIMSMPSGAVIFTGPTGGGKTTLIFDCLEEKARQQPWRRQVWVEDPNELPAAFATQLYVPSTPDEAAKGEAYGQMGRTALRMAPKTIMFGEMRGASVALEFFRACLTGHDGWTTVHTNDPFLTVPRIEMLDPVRLNRRVFCDPETVRAYLGVRLVPKLCTQCRVALAGVRDRIKPRVLRELATWGSLDGVYLRGEGCPECSYAGTQGRKLIMEIVLNDEELAQDFIDHGVAIARRNYRKRRTDACPSLLESAVNLAIAGVIDPRTIEDKVAPLRRKDADDDRASGKASARQIVRRPLNIVRRGVRRAERRALHAVDGGVHVA